MKCEVKENESKIKSKVFIERIKIIINYSILPLIVILLWIFATQKEIFSPVILPSIQAVISSFFSQLQSGQLINDISISFFRVIKGFLLASILGVTFGIIMGVSIKANRFFFFIFNAVRQIPMMAWIPLVILWFGIGEISKVVIITMGAFFPVLVNTISGINQVQEGYIEVGKMFKLSKYDMFRQVYFPSALPSIFVGFKLALSTSWMIVVAAEMIAASSGIGYRINDARSLMESDVVIVGMIVIGTVGIIMDKILFLISKKVVPRTNK